MKAWLLDKLTGVATMRLEDVAEPRAGKGEVVLQMEWAGLNPADRYLAEGMYPARPALPHVLGRDGVGKVVAVGEHVSEWKVGEVGLILRGEVGVSRWGTLAEKTAVPAESLTQVPEGWTHEQAAGGPLVYATAYQALTQWGDRGPQVVLVTGASGGVGVATVQLGKAMGHTVIGLSRSAEKGLKVKALGAAACFDPADTQWRKRLKEFLGERKVGLVVENIGGELFSDVVDTLGMWGCVSAVGRLAGAVPNFNTASLFFRRIKIGGVAVGTYSATEMREAWSKVTGLLGNQRPVVDSVWKFEEAREAFGKLERGPMGKVLVRVAKREE